MLSNKDFKDLLASGSVGNDKKDGKTRFDLKQVKQWDKEIERKYKTTKKPSSETKPSIQKAKDNGYRDRAQERRKNEGKEENELESMAAKLDREQTKYLGGDVEHTHLVKGLDYALLRQVKTNLDTDKTASSNESTSITYSKDISSVATLTDLGKQIKDAITFQRSLGSAENIHKKKTQFSQISFEFDLDPLSLSDLPVMVTGGRLEDFSGDDRMEYRMPANLFTKLKSTFDKAKESKKRKKTANELPVLADLTAASTKIPSKIIDDDDIYGGILSESVGKYVPVGALNTESSSTNQVSKPFFSTAAASSSSIEMKATTEATVDKGDMLKDFLSDDEDMALNIIPNKQEQPSKPKEEPKVLDTSILKPVQELLIKQRKKELEEQEALERAAEGLTKASTMGPKAGPDASKPPITVPKGVIHRGIFDGTETMMGKVPQGGQAMGFGSFDTFSNINDFEIVNSDYEDDDEPQSSRPTKRRKKK